MATTDDVLRKLMASAVREALGEDLRAIRAELAALRREGGRGKGGSAQPPARRGRPPGRARGGDGGITALTGPEIKSLRARLGLTQTAFAKLAGVSHVAVYLWESGKTRPQGKNLVALQALANTTPAKASQRLSSGDVPEPRRRKAAATTRGGARKTSARAKRTARGKRRARRKRS